MVQVRLYLANSQIEEGLRNILLKKKHLGKIEGKKSGKEIATLKYSTSLENSSFWWFFVQ